MVLRRRLREFAKTLEKCMSDLEEMVSEIPRLLNLRFEFVRAQLD